MSTTTAFAALNEAVAQLHDAQKLVAGLQECCAPGAKGPPLIASSALWGRLETIDDRLHEALTKLGG
jgi:hypothetical protein